MLPNALLAHGTSLLPRTAPCCHALPRRALQWPCSAEAGTAALCGAACAAGSAASRRYKGNARMIPRMALGPTPAWDATGGSPALPVQGGSLQVEAGRVNRVVWMCWTGHNPIPSHLQLCLKTIQRNAGMPVILVTPSNVLQYLTDLHPAYPYLHLQHRADYLRCRLLHLYGGIYLDMDTICLQDLNPLFDLLESYDAVGYDGSQWGELIGISDMGPFKPYTEITTLWYNALQGKLQERLSVLQEQKTYAFYWQEILRDIFVPASLAFRERVSTALQAHNPEQDVLWSTGEASELLDAELQRCHIFILNNSKYGHELACLTEEQILGGPAILSQVLRQALGLPEPSIGSSEVPSSDVAPREGLPLTVGVGTCQVHSTCQVPPDMMETMKQIGAPSHFLISVGEQLDWAFGAGYRLVDTAQRYGNEDGVGQALSGAIQQGRVRREEVFITTKIEQKNMGYDTTLRSFEQSLSALQVQYVDLLLLHFPPAPELRRETWAALERLHDEGKVLNIGVANHSRRHLEEMSGYARIQPSVNQIEVHPYHAQFDLVDYCLGQGIAVMGYSPLGGRGAAGADTGVTDALLSEPVLLDIARAHGKTAAQIMLRWALQRGVTPIPKAASPERLAENLAALNFELPAEDMQKINTLDRGQYVVCDLSRLQ
eukprot:TRINITY_DN26907_c0_g1_i1.p1 TRINITY_DN26907_c0_g1~~TRINITY_DN26907_c0_g1_i1.p1  ORF type:complete len:672 (+),score=127.89 TRINITY_DN26907_c0_g1_i1:41-2017(+)